MAMIEPPANQPAMSGSVLELQGFFATDAAMQDAVTRLEQAGFDRANLSVPAYPGELNAAAPHTDTDQRQARTLGTSLAAAAGALATAGVVVATGGVAVPVVLAAAVAGGVGAGGLTGLAASAMKSFEGHSNDIEAARGDLVLTVRLSHPEDRARAEQAMREAGATRWQAIDRQVT